MPVRDLVAEGRAKLAALNETPSSNRAFDLAEWAGLNLADLLDELEAQRERVNELAAKRNPDDEVLVEGSWFHPDDLPKILGNVMRSSNEEARRGKGWYIELEKARARIAELEAQLDRVRAIHEPIDALNIRHHPNGRLTRVCSGCGTDDGNWQVYPCPTIRALEVRP